MPKKYGIPKSYSFTRETVNEIKRLCKEQKRTETSLLEYLIYKEYKEVFNGEWTERVYSLLSYK